METVPPAPRPADGLAWPMSFDARYGAGLDRAISLGGGGIYFVAWQVGYLHALAQGGLDLATADRVVGTSAGSLVATALCGGRVGWLRSELAAVGRFPALISALAPAGKLRPSQERALMLFHDAADADPATVQEIGRAAMAAAAPDPARLRANLSLVLGAPTWPSDRLHITCVDAYTGERCVVTAATSVRPARAAAASSAVPGLFPPQPVGDRRCMDGGVSGSGTHLDLLAGARRVLVLSLVDGTETDQSARMTVVPDAVVRERAALEAAGATVVLRSPSNVRIEDLMSPEVVPQALEAGAALATADLPELLQLWA